MSKVNPFLSLLLGVVCAASTSTLGQEVAVVNAVRVEEDWELVVNESDRDANAPQISCTMGTSHDLTGVHAVLEINHRSLPSYSPGGVQLQVWSGETVLERKTLERFDQMSTGGETVTWTMFMKKNNGNLYFGVKNGVSLTWDSFGGTDWVSQGAGDLSLDDYCTDCSVACSSVGFSGNRVQSLILKQVRWYDANGLTRTDSTPRVVHQK